MLSLLPVSSPQGPYPLLTLPASMRMLSHPHTYSCLSVLLSWVIKLSQEQGASDSISDNLPLHILELSVPPVYLLVGGLVPRSFGGEVWWVDIVVCPGGCKPFQLLQSLT